MTENQSLTRTEQKRLAALEAVVEAAKVDAMAAFVQLGSALREIREGRLYRATHSTWAVYCRDRHGIDYHHADRWIGAARVNANLTEAEFTVLPTTESQARHIRTRPPDEQRLLWAEILTETGGAQPTAADVRRVVERRTLTVGGRPALLEKHPALTERLTDGGPKPALEEVLQLAPELADDKRSAAMLRHYASELLRLASIRQRRGYASVNAYVWFCINQDMAKHLPEEPPFLQLDEVDELKRAMAEPEKPKTKPKPRGRRR